MEGSMTFDNPQDELNYYKSNNIRVNNENNKLEAQIKKLEAENQVLKEKIIKSSKNNNNTSIQFFLPSEFKSLWETIVKTELMEALDPYIEDYIFISNITQDLFLIIYNTTEDLIHLKIKSIYDCLGIKSKRFEDNFEKVLETFMTFFQENYEDIFTLTAEIIKEPEETQEEWGFAQRTASFRYRF